MPDVITATATKPAAAVAAARQGRAVQAFLHNLELLLRPAAAAEGGEHHGLQQQQTVGEWRVGWSSVVRELSLFARYLIHFYRVTREREQRKSRRRVVFHSDTTKRQWRRWIRRCHSLATHELRQSGHMKRLSLRGFQRCRNTKDKSWLNKCDVCLR